MLLVGATAQGSVPCPRGLGLACQKCICPPSVIATKNDGVGANENKSLFYGIFLALLVRLFRQLMAQQREGQETFLIQAMLIWIWYCVKRAALRLARYLAGGFFVQPKVLRGLQAPRSARSWPVWRWTDKVPLCGCLCLPALFLPVPVSCAGR